MLRVSISRNHKECIIIRNNFRSERSHSSNFFEVSNEVPDEPETSHYDLHYDCGIILKRKIDDRIAYLSSLPVGLSRGPTVCCGGGML